MCVYMYRSIHNYCQQNVAIIFVMRFTVIVSSCFVVNVVLRAANNKNNQTGCSTNYRTTALKLIWCHLQAFLEIVLNFSRETKYFVN